MCSRRIPRRLKFWDVLIVELVDFAAFQRNTGAMKKYQDDHALWFLIAGVLFFSCAGTWAIGENLSRDTLGRIGIDALYLAIACLVFGWVGHAILVLCGVRLTGRPQDVQAVDYDDLPSDGKPNPPSDDESS